MVSALLLAAPSARAADPFYDQLLRQGIIAFERGDPASAERLLRVACFGLLDEPVRLTEGLTRLALAQADLDDNEGFGATVSRILEIERRFGGYRKASLDDALRQRFETRLAGLLAYDQLRELPVFAHAAKAKQVSEIAALPAAERRDRLEALLAAEPTDTDWALLKAHLELDTDHPAAARDLLVPILDRDRGHAEATCLLGRAHAALGACTEAVPALDACGDAAEHPAVARERLTCLIRLGDWARAEALLERLPAGVRTDKPFRRLAKDLRRAKRRAPAPATAPAVIAAVSPEREPAGSGSDTSAGDAALQARLEALRAQLAAAPEAEQLAPILAAAQALADAHPQAAEAQYLVAETAYRLRSWNQVVAYTRRGGTVAAERPALLFYLAVALYETGDREAAADALRQCLPRLQTTDFVRDYTTKILGDTPSS